jgi:DNA repair protein RadD
MSALRPLYPHQERAIVSLRGSCVSGKKRPMLQAPTGFGKTKLAAKIIDGALAKGKRIAFIVPRKALIDQLLLTSIVRVSRPSASCRVITP